MGKLVPFVTRNELSMFHPAETLVLYLPNCYLETSQSYNLQRGKT